MELPPFVWLARDVAPPSSAEGSSSEEAWKPLRSSDCSILNSAADAFAGQPIECDVEFGRAKAAMTCECEEGICVPRGAQGAPLF